MVRRVHALFFVLVCVWAAVSVSAQSGVEQAEKWLFTSANFQLADAELHKDAVDTTHRFSV